MAMTLAERLRKWAQELDDDEQEELRAAERTRLEELANEPRLTADEIAWMRTIRERLEAEEAEPEPEPKPAAEPPKPKPKAEPKQTRPGRKAGMAYDWWVDDDGNVTKLDIARVYQGEDEPDEVEIPAAPAAEAEEDAA